METSDKPKIESSGRRLTVLLAVDVCNYSGRIENDEQAAIKLTDDIYSVLAEAVKKYEGRIFKKMGDGFLAEFPSADLGLQASIDFFQGLEQEKRSDKAIGPSMVRAGLHVGDVTRREDGDLMGHGVNIAARLQELATPGTVLASSDIINLIRKSLDFKLHKKEQLKLKNISQRMTAFEFSPSKTANPFIHKLSRLGSHVSFGPTIRFLSLAFSIFLAVQIYRMQQPRTLMAKASQISVLGFENKTSKEELDYLADGLTDILTNSLFQVEGLTVKRTSDTKLEVAPSTILEAPQSSPFQFSGRILEDQKGYILIAQVSQTSDGTIAWSKSFSFENLRELIDLQSEITTDIAEALGVVISEEDQDRMAQIGTENIDAFIAYQKGRALLKFWHQDRNNPDMTKAFEQLQKTMNLDPNWAEPKLHIVDIYHHFIAGDIGDLPEQNAAGAALTRRDANQVIEDNLRQASSIADTDLAKNKALMNAYFFSSDWRDLKTPSTLYAKAAIDARGELEWLFEPVILLVIGEYEHSRDLAEHRILKYDPFNGTGHAYAIRSLLLSGDLDGAEKRLDEAKSLTFSNRLEEVEGFILAARGEHEKLEAHVLSSKKLSDMHKDYFMAQVVATHKDGEPVAAVFLGNSKSLKTNQVYRAFALNHIGELSAAKTLFEEISREPLGDLEISTAMAYGAACGLENFQIPETLKQKLLDAEADLPPCIRD